MKVIILSAGQGTRLLPYTAQLPKCLLEIQGKTLLEWQIGELHKCGIDQITVVTGYGAEKVAALLQQNCNLKDIKTHYNPDFAKTDNLVSCWRVRDEMDEDFILLNGDTLFEAEVIKSLLASPETSITVTIDQKDIYDTDDMKVCLDGTRLVNISKELPSNEIHGESIGMILFRGDGPVLFRKELERCLNDRQSMYRWYLSVIDILATEKKVLTCSIKGLLWCEVDYPSDLEVADRVVVGFSTENNFEPVGEGCQLHKVAAL